MTHKKFPCEENCGACCKNIGNIEELKLFNNGKNECIFLTKDLKCEIYNIRPEVCRVDIVYKKRWSFMSWNSYVELSKECCKLLKEKLK